MMCKYALFLSLILSGSFCQAQDTTRTMTDSTFILTEAVVEGYSYNRSVLEVPVAITTLSTNDLLRYNNTNFLPAINTVPGARMEERSPGSYRLSIRGSSIRSPFGVRNVKLYWNGLPFTDPGGNTYLNLLDFSSIDQFEVIKGPGSSIYGAGTGGVLLLKSSLEEKTKLEGSLTAGSFGLLSYSLKGIAHNEHATIKLQHSHLESDGYRQQTAMSRDVFQGQAEVVQEQSTLSANFLYSDLHYQTPGGLTLQQFTSDPKQARPAGGPNPGAVEQKAAIFNRTFYAAIHHYYEWNQHWSNETGVYGSLTEFKNPAIRNFERRSEQSFGARTNTSYHFKTGKLNFGAEYQHGFSPISVYDNLQGITGNVQYADEITTTTYLAFVQSEFFLPANFFLTIGASVNKLKIDFTRLSTNPVTEGERNFDLVFSPRFALLKKINDHFSAYASYSLGYSPPTIQELYPSTGSFDNNLNSEKGSNTELGLKGRFLSDRLETDFTVYHFNLDNTIVIRRTADNAEYFVNAGKTTQQGIESKVAWNQPLADAFIDLVKIWAAYTMNNYTFDDYFKDNVELSGKNLTGIAPHIFVAGLDVHSSVGIYTNITFTYTDEIPLNDENTAYANGYKLLGGRIGYHHESRHFGLDVFSGIDNALDATYSLGNDLNAVGGRYFNAAAGRNYYAGFKTSWTF